MQPLADEQGGGSSSLAVKVRDRLIAVRDAYRYLICLAYMRAPRPKRSTFSSILISVRAGVFCLSAGRHSRRAPCTTDK